MSEGPQGYEPPRVETVESDGMPIGTAAGVSPGPAAGGSKVEELD